MQLLLLLVTGKTAVEERQRLYPRQQVPLSMLMHGRMPQKQATVTNMPSFPGGSHDVLPDPLR
jgi:hypothetical protein